LGKGIVVNGDDTNRYDLDQTNEDILSCDVSDEALEAAAGPGATGFTVSLSDPHLFTCAIGCC
jgi:hypothetical protein